VGDVSCRTGPFIDEAAQIGTKGMMMTLIKSTDLDWLEKDSNQGHDLELYPEQHKLY
jgi:hypothetical protein